MSDKFDLEERLLEYAARVIRLVEKLPDSRAWKSCRRAMVALRHVAAAQSWGGAGGRIAPGFHPQNEDLPQRTAGVAPLVAVDPTGAIAKTGASAAADG